MDALHKPLKAILGGSADKLADSVKGDSTKQPNGASSKAPVHIWSTDAIRPHERFSYWREALCQAVFNLTIDAAPEGFSARITARSSGTLRFATSESTSYRVVRNRRDIDTAPADHYSVFVQLRGLSVIDQSDASFPFHPNDICISDGRHPFSADLPGVGRRAFAVIPREMINRRAPWLARHPLHKLDGNSPFVDLARRHLRELTAEDATLSDSATSLLTENLCNLLALASARDVTLDRLQPELQTEAMLAFCRQNLHDSELSPQRVADHLGVSVRTLHLRFKQIGHTFGHFVLDSRLEACSTALRDPNQRGLNISDIAYRWGFNDLSHFNKAFRARYSMTPREWRALAE
jgi:AraC family transcriptional activator of tynA and feaB